MICPLAIPSDFAVSTYGIIHEAVTSVKLEVETVGIVIPRAFIVTARNSARVIGLFGRNVPSEYPLRIPRSANKRIFSYANDPAMSLNRGFDGGMITIHGIPSSISYSVLSSAGSVTGGFDGGVYPPPPPPPPPQPEDVLIV